jgi:hypothetical protein
MEGLSVSHISRGDGSVIFVELGELTPSRKVRRDGTLMNPLGGVSINLNSGWRVEASNEILCGSKSEQADASPVLAGLIGRKVLGLSIVGRLPEIDLALDDDRHLTSFTTYQGQPDWAIADHRSSPPRWFDVRKGVVILGDGGPTG